MGQYIYKCSLCGCEVNKTIAIEDTFTTTSGKQTILVCDNCNKIVDGEYDWIYVDKSTENDA